SRPAGARRDARCCTGGLSGVRQEGPGLREGGSRGPDWGPSGTPRAHGAGGCENGPQRAHSGRCDAPAARLRQHRQSVAAPRRGSRARARRAASARRGACRHREATVRRERSAGGRWWRAGVWPGAGAVTLLLRLAPAGLPRLDMIRIAPAPLAIAGAATVLAVLLFSLLPVVSTVRCDLSSQLRADARSGTEGRRLRAVRRTLVASQIALALVL